MGETIALTTRDWEVLHAIDRHGPLPSNYLCLLTKNLAKGKKHHFIQRLTKLFNGTTGTPALLIRYAAQRMHERALSMPLFHGLSPHARMLLDVKRHTLTKPRNDHAVHQFMQACVMASFEAGAKTRGIEFIHRDDILRKAPEDTQRSPDPMKLESSVPDDLFGFRYPNKQYRFFAVEIDRGTEQQKEHSSKNTLVGKLKSYDRVFEKQTYKEKLGIPNLTVLFVTTGKGRVDKSLLELKRESVVNKGKFLFKIDPTFSPEYWLVPEGFLDHLFTPWHRVGPDYDISVPFKQ
jgi:hypothetical protein